MAYSMKDLRYKTHEIMEGLKRGQHPVITDRGRPVAQIIPLKSGEKKRFYPIGYGMWKKHPKMKDVSKWLDDQRKPRFRR